MRMRAGISNFHSSNKSNLPPNQLVRALFYHRECSANFMKIRDTLYYFGVVNRPTFAYTFPACSLSLPVHCGLLSVLPAEGGSLACCRFCPLKEGR